MIRITFTCLITFPLLQLDKASTNLFQKQITFATTLGFNYPINNTPFPIDLTPFRKFKKYFLTWTFLLLPPFVMWQPFSPS